MISVGTAIVDVTPPVGLPMAGFAARTQSAAIVHDSLTARALVVNNMALVTVDVIGIDAELSRRVRSRCMLPEDAVMILATHTHGGPVSMSGRLWAKSDSVYLNRLEQGIVEAIDRASQAMQPARVLGGISIEPGHAVNRRKQNGPVDREIPVLRFVDAQENTLAILASHACHPVVLGADNLQWTSDYLHFTREALESAFPGAVAIVATGCAGDVNTGHTAASSLSIQTKASRSYAQARLIGSDVARSVVDAQLNLLAGGLGFAEVYERIGFEVREQESPDTLAERWRTLAAGGDPVASVWIDWAESYMGKNLQPLSVRCTAFNWCGAQIIGLPGEIFAQTALEIRQLCQSTAPLFIVSYADDNPGYIPHRDAFSEGGYEVDEAHRFYGMGATFAPGSAERLANAGCEAARMAACMAKDKLSTSGKATQGSM
ncbi:MAG: neutral/alkaline non-lysosomal ceramidase N-terminal domain-containing protein [Granulosicoccus sp.]